jgi:hypothetical protein
MLYVQKYVFYVAKIPQEEQKSFEIAPFCPNSTILTLMNEINHLKETEKYKRNH